MATEPLQGCSEEWRTFQSRKDSRACAENFSSCLPPGTGKEHLPWGMGKQKHPGQYKAPLHTQLSGTSALITLRKQGPRIIPDHPHVPSRCPVIADLSIISPASVLCAFLPLAQMPYLSSLPLVKLLLGSKGLKLGERGTPKTFTTEIPAPGCILLTTVEKPKFFQNEEVWATGD